MVIYGTSFSIDRSAPMFQKEKNKIKKGKYRKQRRCKLFGIKLQQLKQKTIEYKPVTKTIIKKSCSTFMHLTDEYQSFLSSVEVVEHRRFLLGSKWIVKSD